MSTRSFPVPLPHGAPRRYDSLPALIAGAASHAQNRLLHACEAISWIGAMSLQWRKSHTPVFTIAGATVQDAAAAPGEQAAHILAGQLLLDGKKPWELVAGERLKLAWLERFMITSSVPIPFNTADSAAEKAGLKQAFRAACESVWSHVRAGERDLTATYEAFLVDADRAFLRAEFAKAGKQAAAHARGDARADERLVEKVILRAYRVHGVTAKDANRLFPLRELRPR